MGLPGATMGGHAGIVRKRNAYGERRRLWGHGTADVTTYRRRASCRRIKPPRNGWRARIRRVAAKRGDVPATAGRESTIGRTDAGRGGSVFNRRVIDQHDQTMGLVRHATYVRPPRLIKDRWDVGQQVLEVLMSMESEYNLSRASCGKLIFADRHSVILDGMGFGGIKPVRKTGDYPCMRQDDRPWEAPGQGRRPRTGGQPVPGG